MSLVQSIGRCLTFLVVLVVIGLVQQGVDAGRSKRNNQICSLPKVVGRCRAAFPRFYYDTQRRDCVKFLYGGCQGNRNNFRTKKQCEKKCVRQRETTSSGNNNNNMDICSLPSKTGPCRAYFTMYYYNQITRRCQNFVYGGCRGNDNRFRTEADCMARCGGGGNNGGGNGGRGDQK